jgi:1-acyl-sn-glycerol-3-phosphate acyltransferase
VRFALVFVWTLLCTPLLIVPIFARLFGKVPSMRWGARVCHVWARGLLRALGVRLQFEGPPPPRGAFLASNHTTWLDILVLAAWQPTNFIAKREVAKIPFLGVLSGFAGTLYLNRESRRDAHRLAQNLEALLVGGLEITLFPEGYCADGIDLLPFRPPLFDAAATLQSPCVPIAIRYDFAAVVWNDGSTVGNHASRMLKARKADRGRAPIVATLITGPALHGSDRKLLARMVEEQVRARFVPFARPGAR